MLLFSQQGNCDVGLKQHSYQHDTTEVHGEVIRVALRKIITATGDYGDVITLTVYSMPAPMLAPMPAPIGRPQALDARLPALA